jgi:tetratricopeptide (TPR) repeat protein
MLDRNNFVKQYAPAGDSPMEILFSALVEAIFAVLIEDLAQRPRLEGLREWVRGGAPEKLALKRALVGAYDSFRRKYPELAAAFFDEHFLRQNLIVQQELSKLLTFSPSPDKQALKASWQAQFSNAPQVDLDEPVTYFLDQLGEEIKKQPLLKPFVDSQALQQLHDIAEGTRQHVDLQAQTVQLLTEIRDLLARNQPQPPPVSTFATTAIFAQTPDDVPEQPKQLIGRDDLLAQVHAVLERGEHVLLQGFGGMGKTALAAIVAAQRIENGKGPVLWLKAGNSDADALFEALARPFDAIQKVASATGNAKIAVMRELLAQTGAKLLVLDDAWNGEALYQVTKTIPHNFPVLVTSRQLLNVGAFLEINELEPGDAILFLNHYAQKDCTEDKQSIELCKKLGYLPFAIEIAGSILKMRKWSPTKLIEVISNAPHEMKVPASYSDRERTSVKDLLDASLTVLDEKSQAAFSAFGAFFAPSLTPELMALFMDRAQLIVESALTNLHDYGLAKWIADTENSQGYYRIHELVWTYAATQATDEKRKRAMKACLKYIRRYNKPSRATFAALHPEIINLLEAAKWAMTIGHYDAVEKFAWGLYADGSGILDYQGLFNVAIVLLQLAIEVARNRGDQLAQRAHLSNQGTAYFRLGQFEQAISCYEQALALLHEEKDKEERSKLLGNLGIIYRHQEDYVKTYEYFRASLETAYETNDKITIAAALGNLGNLYTNLDQNDLAIECYQQSLSIHHSIGDIRNEAADLTNLGNIYRNQGNLTQAIDFYKQAQRISRDAGDRHREASILNNIGVAYSEQGYSEKAVVYLQQARNLFSTIGVTHMVEQVDYNIAIARAAQSSEPSPGESSLS